MTVRNLLQIAHRSIGIHKNACAIIVTVRGGNPEKKIPSNGTSNLNPKMGAFAFQNGEKTV